MDILLTNFCNQSCSFCFASKEMAQADRKEMELSDFRRLLQECKRNHIVSIYLAGGEPTIHTQFIKLITYALRHFFSVNINTNGIFPPEAKRYLLSCGRRVNLMFNIATPGFTLNRKVRDTVLDNIRDFADQTMVELGIADTFLDITPAKKIIDHVGGDILRKTELCWCPIKPIAGSINSFGIKDYSRVGHTIMELTRYSDRIGPARRICFLSGQPPCMFTDQERDDLKKRGVNLRYGCHEKGSWFMVNPDMTAFQCFPLFTANHHYRFGKKLVLAETRDKLRKIHEDYEKKLVLPECRNCRFYGFGEGQCSGPCIAFRLNALRQKE